jgi:hypothetical protein
MDQENKTQVTVISVVVDRPWHMSMRVIFENLKLARLEGFRVLYVEVDSAGLGEIDIPHPGHWHEFCQKHPERCSSREKYVRNGNIKLIVEGAAYIADFDKTQFQMGSVMITLNSGYVLPAVEDNDRYSLIPWDWDD